MAKMLPSCGRRLIAIAALFDAECLSLGPAPLEVKAKGKLDELTPPSNVTLEAWVGFLVVNRDLQEAIAMFDD
eukprot:4754398-Alexandrium_andersonii.AAC.1